MSENKNQMVPAPSLEQAQVRALSVDTDRAQANDDVTLYVASIEQQLREAEKQLGDIIPKLQKQVGDLQSAVAKKTQNEAKTAGAKIAAQFKGVAEFLAKKGFKDCEVSAYHVETTDKDQHAFHVCVAQKHGYNSGDIWLGTRENYVKHYTPISQELKDLKAQHKDLSETLAKAQSELLKVKCDLQKVDMYERQGKALVIRNSRLQTAAGKALVEEIETKAASQLANVVAYVKELEKSTKLLTTSKKK